MAEEQAVAAPAAPAENVSHETVSNAPAGGEPQGTPDSFPVDEAALAALSPESRTAVEPLLKQWKDKLTESVTKASNGREDLEKRSKTLESLTRNPAFQKWYQEQTAPQKPEALAAPQGPSNLPTPEEWASAANDPTKWAALQLRHSEAVADSKIKQIDQKMRDLALSVEFDQVLRENKEWDPLQYDKEESFLLEPLLYYHKDRPEQAGQKGSVKEAFAHLQRVESFFRKKFQAENAKLIQQKKGGVAETPASPAKDTPSVEYASNADEARRRTIKAVMEGRNIQVVIKR